MLLLSPEGAEDGADDALATSNHADHGDKNDEGEDTRDPSGLHEKFH